MLDESKNFVEYNGMEKVMDIKPSFEKLIQIFSSWGNNYSELSFLDAENFKVEIIDGENSKKFLGSGDYPENYQDFKNGVLEIVKCF